MAQKKTALVVGLGLIGGSAAMALRGFENYRVVGTDCSSQTRSYAAAHGVCDEVAERVEDVLGQADVVLFAMRPHGIAQQIEAFGIRSSPVRLSLMWAVLRGDHGSGTVPAGHSGFHRLSSPWRAKRPLV